MTAVLAVRIDGGEQRHVVGYDVGPTAARAFWVGFLRRLAAQRLTELPLVAADGQTELKETLAALLRGRQT
jgi:transposase-like protein